MSDDNQDVDPGEQFDQAPATALEAGSVGRADASVDRRLADENVRAHKAANNYRRALVKWTLRTVAGLTFAATLFMGCYVCSQWGRLEASVMIAYFASIVTETIGILYVITRYLFPSSGPKS